MHNNKYEICLDHGKHICDYSVSFIFSYRFFNRNIITLIYSFTFLFLFTKEKILFETNHIVLFFRFMFTVYALYSMAKVRDDPKKEYCFVFKQI